MNQLLPSLVELDHHAEIQPEFGSWRTGYGPFEHALETQAAVFRLAHQLVQAKMQPDLASVYRLLQAIDRIGSAGLWLVVHMTYARRVRLDDTTESQSRGARRRGVLDPVREGRGREETALRDLGGAVVDQGPGVRARV